MNWIGFTYLEAEMPRIDNEHILDNMKGGVIIFEEKSHATQFANQAVKLIDTELQSVYKFSMTSENYQPTVDLK